jgi:hypothetical protein
MIDNYEDLTVDETLDAVSDFEPEVLQEFIDYERDHKDRSTVVEPLEAELEDAQADATDADDEAVVIGDEVTVTHPTNYGYGGGLWFDAADETATVEVTSRIKAAIKSGDLEVVS